MIFILLTNFNLFITVFRRNKLIPVANSNFNLPEPLRLLVNSLKYGLVSSRYYLIHTVLLLSTFFFILDTITAIKVTCSCWFAVIFSFSLKTVVNVCIYSLLNCSTYFVFWLFSFLGYLGFFRPDPHCWHVCFTKIIGYIYKIYIYIYIYIYITQ